jgi:hypothetical protein
MECCGQMKKILIFTSKFQIMNYRIIPFLIVFCVFSTISEAQEAETVRAATEALSLNYSLDADQVKEAYRIQWRKQKNMKEMEGLINSNPAYYNGKLQSLQAGTLHSIRRMLKTKEQLALYDATQRDIRAQRAATQKALSKLQARKIDMESALLAIYAE